MRREVVMEPFKVERASAKIGTLERRLEWLDERIARFGPQAETGPRLNYDRAERDAIAAAIKALRYHRALLEPETDPILALQELLDSTRAILLDMAESGATPSRDVGLRAIAACERTAKILDEIGT